MCIFISLVDLEAHIQDLHEVTEDTNSSLMRAEEKLKLVQEENKDLKSRSYNKSDLQVTRHDNVPVCLGGCKGFTMFCVGFFSAAAFIIMLEYKDMY